MLDNALIKLIAGLLQTGLTSIGQGSIALKQAYQPTQQGVNTVPTIYLYKIGDKRLGSPYRLGAWNMTTESMDYTQSQQYETTFQMSALATQDPSDVNSLTASDILNQAAFVMQSSDMITGLEAQGVGILRVQDVRNPYFTDDRQRYESSPSFDFTVTHKQAIISSVPVIVEDEIDIYPV